MKFYKGSLVTVETSTLGVCNSLLPEVGAALESVSVADMSISQVKAIYPSIHAITSDRLTLNYNLYERKSLIGQNKGTDSTGYYSYVIPFGKPIIREHNLMGEGFFSSPSDAEIPSGRAIWAGYTARDPKSPSTPRNNKYFPGTEEGTGFLNIIAGITEEEGIKRVLGNVYHTVSIGALVDSVIESISGVDLVKAYRSGGEMPDYQKGQVYDEQLSYYKMGPIRAQELSWVNNPSDQIAGVLKKDIGEEGIQLLLAQKKMGTKEFHFFDAKTLCQVKNYNSTTEGIWDPTYLLVDSIEYQPNTILTTTESGFRTLESYKPSIDNSQETTMENVFSNLTKESKVEEFRSVLPSLITEGEDKSQLSEADLDLCNFFSPLSKEQTTSLIENKNITVEFKDKELIASASDWALKLVGGWNEASVSLAVNKYISEGGEIEFIRDPNQILTLAEFLGMEIAEGETSPELSITVGEEKEAVDSLEFIIARSLLVNKDKQINLPVVGIDPTELSNNNFIALYSVTAETLIDSKLADVLNMWETLATEEQKTNFTKEQWLNIENTDAGLILKNKEALQTIDWKTIKWETKVAPLYINVETVINHFLQKVVAATEYLAPLVGLVRTLNISKQDVAESAKAYGWLGESVLRFYLESAPEKTEHTATPPEPQSQSQPIQQDPHTESVSEDLKTDSKTETKKRSLDRFVVKRPRR